MTEPNVPVLAVDDLRVRIATDAGQVRAVDGVSFALSAGASLGIVGESGSGKSVTALAVLGLLPAGATASGSVRFHGRELLTARSGELTAIRGGKVAMIFQDPMTSLNPVYSVGYQVVEAIRAHQRLTRDAARARAEELLAIVGIPHAKERMGSYPHQLSGGMRQRVVIAIAMANDPDVIIADEPTTALDVTVQAQVLDALARARAETGAALVLISHDLGVVAGHADRVVVMYAGRAVEQGSVTDVYYRARMPYTAGLLASTPRLDHGRDERLAAIPGSQPTLVDDATGCSFAPRCPIATQRCSEEPPELLPATSDTHLAACHHGEKLAAAPSLFQGDGEPSVVRSDGEGAVLLSVRDLVKHFPVKSNGLVRRQVGEVHAVCGVSFDVHEHETLGVVGESGCGKTTTGRLLLGLLPATAGQVRYRDKDVAGLSRRDMRALRREVQIVFQDPFATLDPRMPVHEVIAEPLRVQRTYGRTGRERVAELMRLVGLQPDHADRYPHEFSGGQRQRIGIARALALEPRLVVLDEPVSALDVSVQAGVLRLLKRLQDTLDLSYVFVSHDLSVVRHVADRVAVMYLGRIVELATAEELFSKPAHPYTQTLISAVPLPDPDKERTRLRIAVEGELPSALHPPTGCRFRSRCPRYAHELAESERTRCVDEDPALRPRGGTAAVACHYPAGQALL